MQRLRVLALATLTAVAVGSGSLAAASGASASTVSVRSVCAAPAPGEAACFALAVTGAAHLSRDAGPSGYHPADLLDAYQLDSTRGTGQTVAIVDAFDDPNAEADLAVYRSTFGIPACTTANGCFRKVNQDGAAAPLPKANTSWTPEISIDVDMVSAICPNCHILLVEANNASFTNLGIAVDRAATMGATEISNSYGGREGSGSVAPHYDHPGVPITASTGDGGYAAGPQSPADFATVTAVGGTSLVAKQPGSWSETAWAGAGSGCSRIVAKPAWQHDKRCKRRTIGDVSAVGDPFTGVSVYDTFHAPGFLVYGGTSVSAPIIAGVYALAGNGASVNDASAAYANPAALTDVTKGSNGSCGGTYLCTAKRGYDGPTGLGTPIGTGAF